MYLITFMWNRVHHSTQSIIKPPPQNKSNEAAQKEIEEAVNRVKEAQQSILSAVLTPGESAGKHIEYFSQSTVEQ